MAPKQRQKIEIETTHRDPLLSFNQAVTVGCSDFLGTALGCSGEDSVFCEAGFRLLLNDQHFSLRNE